MPANPGLCLHTFGVDSVFFKVRNFGYLIWFLIAGCSMRPGNLSRLADKGVTVLNEDTVFQAGPGNTSVEVVYLGCGGIYMVRNGEGLLVDPFFSNQKFGKIGRSVLLSENGKPNLRSDPQMISKGVETIRSVTGNNDAVLAILNTHGHYDHLMDVPLVWQKLGHKPPVLLNASAFNTVHKVIDTAKMVRLEEHMTTPDLIREPYRIRSAKSRINIYPIVADHNPHFRHIKFFDGGHTRKINDVDDALAGSRANVWLEGRTFAFLIDYLDESDSITFRIFIQSSSCNPPAGIPPVKLTGRQADLVFLGVASHSFSPDYPCEWLSTLSPGNVIWIHWEDFFRKYTKSPKLLRGSNIPDFFDRACVQPYVKKNGKMAWPGTKLTFVY